jgi:hypothetical protein
VIRYRLSCGSGHEFESWFPAIDAFDTQLQSGAVACPICGSTEIAKQPMAPAVVTSRSRRSGSERTGNSGRGGPAETAVSAQAQTQAPAQAGGGDGAAARIGMLRALRERIVGTSEDVGGRFAEEARKMHFGEIEERNIRGNSTVEEARDLVEDGVPFGLIPVLPEDLN